MSIPYIPCPTRTVTFTISLAPGSVTPQLGYFVRWRIYDDSNNPGVWSDYTQTSSTTIQIGGIPRCNRIQIEVKASCGTERFGASTFFTVEPNISYTTVITQSGACSSNGDGVYTLTGTPGQYATIGLEFQGNMQYNNFNSSGGACAWIETSISSLEALTTSATQKSINITGTSNVTMPASSCQISVQFPASGVVTVNTSVKMYNVTSANTSSATLKVLSIGGVATNDSLLVCKAQLQSNNCG